MKITVTGPEDVIGRFLAVQQGGTPVVAWVAQATLSSESGVPALHLYDREDPGAHRLGFVRVGDTATLATDEQVSAYVSAAPAHLAPPAPARRPVTAAAFPAAVVFSTAFLLIAIATGNTGLSFLTSFSPLSQLVMPVLAGGTAGAGLILMGALDHRRALIGWEENCALDTRAWAARQRRQAEITQTGPCRA